MKPAENLKMDTLNTPAQAPGYSARPILRSVEIPPRSQKLACRDCALCHHCMAKPLDKDSMQALNDMTRHPKPRHKGQHIYRQNDSFNTLYTVRSGAVKTYRIDEHGEEYITGFYLPGEIFGTDGMAAGEHSNSAEAIDTTALCEISIHAFKENAKLYPELQDSLLSALSAEMFQRQQPLTYLHHKHVDERLATFLTDISTRLSFNGRSNTEFNLPMSRRDIAQYLGMTEETISRVFSRFQKQKLLTAKRHNITICDRDALQSIAMSF